MGGLTFNIGSLGMFADMMATGIARTNATGQAGKFGEIAQKLSGMGVLEINIGSNGITGKFGMGGFDLVGSLYTFGKRMSDKAALESYAMQERVSQEEAEAAYWAYVYGDWTQENTAARISSGVDVLHIVDEMTDGANAQTVQNKDGTGRVITMKDTGDVHKNAVTLGHESYRDGIVRNQSDQQRETFNAVLGHAGMAERMTQYDNDFIFTGLLAAEIEAYKNGDMTALMMDSLYNYSSDADYWKIISKMDGTIDVQAEYDENGNLIKEVTIEYQDFEGKILGEYKPDNQAFQNSLGQAGSLANIYGLDRMEKMLGGDLNNASIYDDQTLYDIFKDEQIVQNIRRTGRLPDVISDQQKLSLAGEAFLKKNNFSYDGANWKINGSSEDYTFAQHLAQNVKGSLVANSFVSKNTDGSFDMSKYNVNIGGFNYLTLFEEVERHPLSYTLNNGDRKEITNSTPNRYLDTRTVTAYDLNGKQIGDGPLISDGWITVQSAMPDTKSDKTAYTKNDFINKTISGSSIKVGPETIKEGPIAYQMKIATDNSLEKLKLNKNDSYMQAVYGQILAGNNIGTTGEADFAIGRHLLHPAVIGNNYGCGVTDKYNFSEYMDYLKGYGAKPGKTRYDKYGTVIFGRIRQKSIPGVYVY